MTSDDFHPPIWGCAREPTNICAQTVSLADRHCRFQLRWSSCSRTTAMAATKLCWSPCSRIVDANACTSSPQSCKFSYPRIQLLTRIKRWSSRSRNAMPIALESILSHCHSLLDSVTGITGIRDQMRHRLQSSTRTTDILIY